MLRMAGREPELLRPGRKHHIPAGAYLAMAVLKKPFHCANTALERKFKEAQL